MTSNFKLRVYTSVILFLILFLMFLNNIILGYFLIVLGVISLLEFYNLNKIIFTNKIYKKFFFNLFITIYISSFCSFILILSFLFHFKVLMFVILITCIASDIGGFTFGKLFKGPKLTKISPNKTISGAIGSIFFSVFFLSLLMNYLIISFNYVIILVGFLTSLSCQTGDLLVSFLKRKSLTKDTGNLLPGHGGVLDRVDGILLGLPVGFFTLLIVY